MIEAVPNSSTLNLSNFDSLHSVEISVQRFILRSVSASSILPSNPSFDPWTRSHPKLWPTGCGMRPGNVHKYGSDLQ